MSDVLKRAQDNYQKDKDHWSDIYRKAREDLLFVSDDENAQWTKEDRDLRTKRPCLTVDQLGQFIHQVANTIRMNTPTINVIPETDGDVETAEAIKGLIKHIEYKSSADEAYDTASLSSIRCSIGFIFVDHGYVNDTSFEQEFAINRCVDALQVWLDRDSIEADGSDAKHGIKVQSLSVAKFKEEYPKAEVSSFGEEKQKIYKDDDSINIAEYFEIVTDTKEVGLTESGDMEEVAQDIEYASTRTFKKTKVMRYILSGAEVLKESRFPGKYIPIVPVYGEEAWIDGKRQLYSLIRKSKDAQRMFNYWKSLETELLMKQPNAPIMAVGGQIENYAEDWQNPQKSMVLRYDMVDAEGKPAPAPQRLDPPQIPAGIVNAARATIDDIKATMGIYNASLGQASNETSGIAISRRKEEGDVATYHFGDNLKRSITQVGKIIVCGLAELYDTPRLIATRGLEDQPKIIGINGSLAPDQKKVIDLRKGEYSVFVTTGASSLTKRQEAADFFTEIIKSQPELIQVMGDLLFKNMDISGAQEMAERMKKVIDPKFLDENKEKEFDPEKEQMAQIIEQGKQLLAQQQAELADLQQQLKNKDGEVQVKVLAEQNKTDTEHGKLEIELMRLRQEAEKIQLEKEIKLAELALKQRELDIRQEEIAASARQQEEQMRLNSQQIESDDTDS